MCGLERKEITVIQLPQARFHIIKERQQIKKNSPRGETHSTTDCCGEGLKGDHPQPGSPPRPSRREGELRTEPFYFTFLILNY